MTDGKRSQTWLFWLGLGLSLTIHIGIAMHLLTRDAKDFGATDITTTAISVNIESSDILESLNQSEATEAAAAVASTAGEPIPPQETEPEKAEVTPPSEPEKAEAESPPLPETAEDEAAKEEARRNELAEQVAQQRLAEEALKQAAEAEREKQAAERRAREQARQLAEEREAREEREAAERETERKRQAAENRKKAEKQVRKKSGDRVASTGTSGSRGAKASTGRVSASQGDVQNYKGMLNAWLKSRRKPPHDGRRGNVDVVFSVSPSGALISAVIRSSSGDNALDQKALAAMRGSAPFPKPPPGLTDAQRRFSFKYSFE